MAVSHARSGVDDVVFAEVSRVVFEETRTARARLHSVRGALRCDARFAVGQRFQVSGGCPCVDEYIDAVIEVLRYLRGQDLAVVRSVGAVARVHCRTRVVRDLERNRRAEQSQARTDRLADSAIGRALGTAQQRALLRHVADEASSAAPLAGQAQLVRRLAELRSREFGGSEVEHETGVARDLRIVRAAAIRHGRRHRSDDGDLVDWWEFYIERGLGRRPILSTSDSEALGVRAVERDHTDDEVVSAITSGPPSVASVRGALRELAARGVLAGGVAEPLLADSARLKEIVAAARGLVRKVA